LVVDGESYTDYDCYYSGLGEQFRRLYGFYQATEGVDILLNEDQKLDFRTCFQSWKDDIRGILTGENMMSNRDLDSTVHRAGLVCFRVCMILTALRAYEEERVLGSLLVSDEDYAFAVEFASNSIRNSVMIYGILPRNRALDYDPNTSIRLKKKLEALERKEKAGEANKLVQGGMSLGQISQKLSIPKSTVNRWVKVD
jgi:hypothetical protein